MTLTEIWTNFKYLLIGLVVITLLSFLMAKCSPGNVVLPGKTMVATAAYSIPTASDKKLMPGVKEVIKIPHETSPIGYIVQQEILIGVSQTVKISSSDTLYTRWKPFYGLYIDGTLTGLGAGLRYSPLGYWRINMDILAGYPRVGAALDFQVLENTFVGLEYAENYTKLAIEPGVFVSLNF